MSAAQMMAGPDEAAPHVLEAENAPRRVTGAALMRRMMAVPANRRRLANGRIMPLHARHTLRAVADLVAEAGGEVLTVAPSLLPGSPGPGSEGAGVMARLAYEVMIHIPCWGMEAQIERHIAALAAAQLIAIDGDQVRLDLPPEMPAQEAAPRPETGERGANVHELPGMAVSRRTGLPLEVSKAGRIGPPRRGESDAAYKARQQEAIARAWAAHNARQAAQTTLPLPPTMVRMAASTTVSPASGHVVSPAKSGSPAPAQVRTYGESGLGESGSPDSGLAVVVVESGSSSNQGLTPTPTTTTTARESGVSPDLMPDLIVHDLPDLPGKVDRLAHRPPDEVERLAGVVIRTLALKPGAVTGVVPFIRARLKEGVPLSLMAAQFELGFQRHQGGNPIHHVGWFERPIAAAWAAERARAAPPPGLDVPEPQAKRPVDPRIAAIAAWADAPSEQHYWLLNLLDVRGRTPTAWQVNHVRNKEPAIWATFLCAFPEAGRDAWWDIKPEEAA